jgi:hypothetical protein
MPAQMKPSPSFLAGLALLGAGALGCVSPPSPQEVLDTGYRTPEQTFHTLQVGVRGDLPALEYACLSGAFRARHGLSQLAYREFRERVLQGEIAYWLGIPAAEIRESRPLGVGRRLLVCESHGETFELELVREDFWQMWVEGELVADEALEDGSFSEWTEVFRDSPGTTLVLGHAQLPARLSALDAEELDAGLSEFRIGREWKIDEFHGLDPSP